MKDIHPDTLTALSQRVVRFAALALVEFPSPNRLAFTTLGRQITYNGDTFVSGGNLGSISGAASNSTLDPAEYEIIVSGVSDDILQAAGQLDYMNHPATAWLLVLDDQDQIIGDPVLWFEGETDQVRVRYGEVSSVQIRVRNAMSDWQRIKVQRYTDGEHQQQYPGDKFFEFMSEVASKEVEWPAKTWFEKNRN